MHESIARVRIFSSSEFNPASSMPSRIFRITCMNEVFLQGTADHGGEPGLLVRAGFPYLELRSIRFLGIIGIGPACGRRIVVQSSYAKTLRAMRCTIRRSPPWSVGPRKPLVSILILVELHTTK